MRLSDVNTNETVMISHIEGSGAFRARLSEMGFVTGKTVKKLFTSPVGNPRVFGLMGGQIALRKSEAEKIQVTVSGTADAPQTFPQTFRLKSIVQTGINEEAEPLCRRLHTRDAPVAVLRDVASPPTRRPKPRFSHGNIRPCM